MTKLIERKKYVAGQVRATRRISRKQNDFDKNVHFLRFLKTHSFNSRSKLQFNVVVMLYYTRIVPRYDVLIHSKP